MSATSVTKLTFALRRNSKSRLTLQAPQPVALEKGKRPTKRAIRMANALRLEQMLHAGQFRSLADIRMTYGITRMVLATPPTICSTTPRRKSPPSSGKPTEPGRRALIFCPL